MSSLPLTHGYMIRTFPRDNELATQRLKGNAVRRIAQGVEQDGGRGHCRVPTQVNLHRRREPPQPKPAARGHRAMPCQLLNVSVMCDES